MAPNPESNETDTATEDPQAAETNSAQGESADVTTADGVEVQTPEFQAMSDAGGSKSPQEISRFADIKVTVSAELGRTSIPIEKLLSLGNGSVLELDRSITSPIELIAQGVPLACGEVVVVDDCFAIRITEVYPRNRRGEEIKVGKN
jgi:flagellar motor switch protein FliN/FliY